MRIDFFRNSIRGIVYGFINKLIWLVVPFFLRTVIIKNLGNDYVGLGSLFTSILSVFNVVELGISSAMIFSIYDPLAKNDKTKINSLLNLYKTIYRFFSIVILVVGLCATPFIEIFISGDIPEDINCQLVFLLYLLHTVLHCGFFSYKKAILFAHQRNDIIEKTGILCKLIATSLQFFVLVAYKNFYAYVLCNILCTAMDNFICYCIANIHYGEYQCIGKTRKEDRKIILTKVKSLFLQKAGASFSSSLNSIFISSFMGLVSVGIYSNYAFISSSLTILSGFFFNTLIPGIGNKLVVETEEKNHAVFEKLFFLNNFISCLFTTCLFVLYQHFITIWLGETYLLNGSTVILMSLLYYINQSRKPLISFKDAAGLWEKDRWKSITGSFVHLIFCFLFINRFGIDGVVFSSILSHVILEIPWEARIFFNNMFLTKKKTYWHSYVKNIFVTFVSCFLSYFLCNIIHSVSVGTFILKGCTAFVLSTIIFAVFNKKSIAYAITFSNKLLSLLKKAV